MTVSCEQFEALLLDLAYGELEAERADELRTHAAGCPACRESLGGILLTRKLVSDPFPLEPEPSLDVSVLSAAGAFAEAMSAAEIREDIAAPHGPAVLDEVTWGYRFRRFFMKPAFATAAVAATVLMVTSFIVSRGPENSGDFMDGAESYGQAVDLEESRKREVEPLEAPTASNPKAAAPDQPVPVSPASPVFAEAPPAPKGAFNLGTSGRSAPRLAHGKPEKSESIPEKLRAPRRSPSVPEGASGTGTLLNRDDHAQAKRKGASMVAADPSETEGGEDDLSRGIAAYRRGDCGTAEPILTRVVQSAVPPREKAIAIHHIARCEKRRGQCGRAISWYDRLLDYHAYPGRGDALYESAQCHRRLGHLPTARSLLIELSRMPDEDGRAGEALDRLDDADPTN